MANAIESAVLAMLPKLLQNLPPEITDTIGQISKIVLGAKGQLDRIEKNQHAIMLALDIPAEPEILEKE